MSSKPSGQLLKQDERIYHWCSAYLMINILQYWLFTGSHFDAWSIVVSHIREMKVVECQRPHTVLYH